MIKKAEYIQKIKDTEACADMTKKDIEAVLKAQSEVLLDIISQNESVKIGDVVTVGGKHRDARTGRNPATGAALDIPAKDGVPYAKFSSTAKA
nr:MAG TPA: DNA binding protein [Caudoviricetes sp.]DAP25112.1 MAG TPA: DNA binding protein [Caudoviricetes sp.]